MFMDNDFLLDTKQAKDLYHQFAENMPIFDFHSHLNPAWIANNYQFADMAEIWLAGDHYKWRAMRTVGVDESFCTGEVPAKEKFNKWAETVPRLLRNPLYHWTHLELKRPFGIEGISFSPKTADFVWHEGNEKLQTAEFGARGIAHKMNVVVSCTTDDPIDTLEFHLKNNSDPNAKVVLLPTWRPDKARQIGNPNTFNQWLDCLARISGKNIDSLSDFLGALTIRHDFFAEVGCKLSDHSLESFTLFSCGDDEAEDIFKQVRSGLVVSLEKQKLFSFYMLRFFAKLDFEKDWVQQYHIGALRNPNAKMFSLLGADTGFDAMGDENYIQPLANHLSNLAKENILPRTILYNLNPKDNAAMAVLAGSFQDGTPGGRVQYGAAWWFLDQMNGMTQQIETLSQLGVLSQFVGMVTDSRSILSFTRHEYFRRILCQIFGSDMAKGLIEDDLEIVGKVIQDISFNNANQFFKIKR